MSTKRKALTVEGLRVEVEGKEVIKELSLNIYAGERLALMGPNGSGKSSLSNALVGHPSYEITQGRIYLNGEDITDLSVDKRAKLGLFLAMQYPVAIPGVSVANFLRSVIKAQRGKEVSIREFRSELKNNMEFLEINKSFASRYINDGFSGGERKKMELLQMLMLKPRLAIIDEIDSGLDVDALKIVSNGISGMCGPDNAMLLITHYRRILDYVPQDRVCVMINGSIVETGGPELVDEIETKGYEWLQKKVA